MVPAPPSKDRSAQKACRHLARATWTRQDTELGTGRLRHLLSVHIVPNETVYHIFTF